MLVISDDDLELFDGEDIDAEEQAVLLALIQQAAEEGGGCVCVMCAAVCVRVRWPWPTTLDHASR
jgi:hypothetical protein